MLWLIPSSDLVYINIKKNAATAVIKALSDNGVQRVRVTPDTLPACPRVAMWRNPYRRLESAYNFFAGVAWSEVLIPFPEWVMMVCNGKVDDEHVLSQYEFSSHVGRWLPTEVIRWDFSKLAERLGVPEIPRANASVKRDLRWSDEARNACRHWYAKDFEIWEQWD